MGFFRFRRSIKIAPGVRWNFGKKSTSFSFGPRGFKLTAGTRGVRTTVGVPGTGVSYTHVVGSNHPHPHHEHAALGMPPPTPPAISSPHAPFKICAHCGAEVRQVDERCWRCQSSFGSQFGVRTSGRVDELTSRSERPLAAESTSPVGVRFFAAVVVVIAVLFLWVGSC